MMKSVVILAISMILAAGCSSPRLRPHQNAMPEGAASTQEQPLFLHLLAPRAYTDPSMPAHRIATARVYLFQDFSISIGDPEDPFTNQWEGAWTNARWSSNGTPEARPLESLWNSGEAVLAGRIELVNGELVAHLQGRNRTTLNYFHGEIELERPVFEQGGYYRGGIWGVCFALSTNQNCSGFLKALEDGTLRPPNVVDRDSPVAERWERGKQNRIPRSPSAEPERGSNGRQPLR